MLKTPIQTTRHAASVRLGARWSGVGLGYRQSIQLASGRFAMLDDSLGFSQVPWRPVIKQPLGQQLSAVVRGTSVTWEFARRRGPALWQLGSAGDP
jgi:hypothetical protein